MADPVSDLKAELSPWPGLVKFVSGVAAGALLVVYINHERIASLEERITSRDEVIDKLKALVGTDAAANAVSSAQETPPMAARAAAQAEPSYVKVSFETRHEGDKYVTTIRASKAGTWNNEKATIFDLTFDSDIPSSGTATDLVGFDERNSLRWLPGGARRPMFRVTGRPSREILLRLSASQPSHVVAASVFPVDLDDERYK